MAGPVGILHRPAAGEPLTVFLPLSLLDFGNLAPGLTGDLTASPAVSEGAAAVPESPWVATLAP